jgi:acetyl esterase/lipase
MESQRLNQRFKIKICISYFGMGGDFLIDKWINGTTQSEKDRLEPLVEMVISSGNNNNNSLVEESDRPYTSTLEGYDTSERTKYIWDYWLATGTLIDILTSTNGKGSSLGILPYNQRLSSLSNSDSNVIPQLWLTTSPIAKFFPPTLLIHGTSDDAVPYEESLNTLNQLENLGVDVELITVEGADHNLNKARVTKKAEGEGEEEEAVEAEGTIEAHQKVVRWLIKALG